MSLKIYNSIGFADPDDPSRSYVDFGETVIGPAYGFLPMRLFFGGVDKMDWPTITKAIKNKDYVPDNLFVVFDLESDESIIHFPKYRDQPRQSAVTLRMKLLEYARSIRPDCEYSYFGFTSDDFWPDYWTPEGLDKCESNMRFSRSVMQSQDVICPQFYATSTVPIEKTCQWLREEIRLIRKVCPSRIIRPFISPHWYEAMTRDGLHETKHEWTPKEIDRVTIPADKFGLMLDTLVASGVSEVIAYTACTQPFDGKQEWLAELLKR